MVLVSDCPEPVALPRMSSDSQPLVTRALVENIVREVVRKRLAPPGAVPAPKLVVDASARHMHVSRADLDILFGKGYELGIHRPLYQDGHYAAKETVTLIGPRSRLISNLRILGPIRDRSQVELAFTDAISVLGASATVPPIRARKTANARAPMLRAAAASSSIYTMRRKPSRSSPASLPAWVAASR